MEELYENLYGLNNVTIISNEFLDKYLADTKPAYMKVFLFYLWKGIKEGYTIAETSNEIDLDEDEIEMALKYWIKKKMIKRECLIRDRKSNLDLRADEGDKVVKQSNIIDLNTKKKEMMDKSKKDYASIEQNLLFVAEKLLGKTLSERQQCLIAKCYNEYKFDECLIQYLLEYCSNINETDARYMGAVAASWYEKNIKIVDDAKKFTESFNKNRANGKSKSSKANNKRILDRNDDSFWKTFTNSDVNGKFK